MQNARVRQEGARALGIVAAQLVDVLQDRPELRAIARHQPHGTLDRLEAAQRGELVEQEQHRSRRLPRRAGQLGERLADDET